jgi:hypothetical protein
VIASNILVETPPFFQSWDRQLDPIQPVTLGMAVLDSARFPYISPTGQLASPGLGTWGHLVDGGYADNTGALAIDELLPLLLQAAAEAGLGEQIKPVVLYISNDIDQMVPSEVREMADRDHYPPARIFVEFIAPLLTLDASRQFHNRFMLDTLWRDASALNIRRVPELHLRSHGVPIPLGWTLSPSAFDSISTAAYTDPEDHIIRDLMTLLRFRE